MGTGTWVYVGGTWVHGCHFLECAGMPTSVRVRVGASRYIVVLDIMGYRWILCFLLVGKLDGRLVK